jgi:hypothetical protein
LAAFLTGAFLATFLAAFLVAFFEADFFAIRYSSREHILSQITGAGHCLSLLACVCLAGTPRHRRKFVPPGFRASLVQPVPRDLILRLRIALPCGTRQHLN